MLQYSKVKIVRSENRGGLIKARLRGEAVAKGPILTFLDSHIEVTKGWLEPQLDRIAADPTTVVCPVADNINSETFKFEYSKSNVTWLAGFRFETLMFDWFTRPNKDPSVNPFASQPSPVMAGCMFSIDKAFFNKLGLYDPEFGE
jgi:polypeptide N-acetylgalactosaminyltransferase